MDCPYEKREDNGGKLIRKDKAKSFPSKNNFTKKTPPKGLVAHEEYPSDDEVVLVGERLGLVLSDELATIVFPLLIRAFRNKMTHVAAIVASPYSLLVL